MAKSSKSYQCSQCGAIQYKWAGQCPDCSSWNTLVERVNAMATGPKGVKALGNRVELGSLQDNDAPLERIGSGNEEFDRVLGGGLVPGSAILVGGDPGIGKSTLLLQAAAGFAKRGEKSVYISGEEAASQIRLRASRLGLSDAPVQLGTATNLRDILATLENESPVFAVIDSIQTLWADHIDSAPGTVSQVRGAVHELVTLAKRKNISIVLVGHVTKEGQIAGPRVVEHMVDTVLYFEGERGHSYRILRAVKNRFGAADEIGVFEMTGRGLQEVRNPSALFLADRDLDAAGSAVFAGIEGSRPVLVEFQALIAPTSYGTPRRAVIGWDNNRLAMILAVLESRAGVGLGQYDIYLNVAGGIRIQEPAADLAAAAALLSAYRNFPLSRESVFFGEISLSGALRTVPQPDNRVREAQKLGFQKAIAPTRLKLVNPSALEIETYRDLTGFVGNIFGEVDQ